MSLGKTVVTLLAPCILSASAAARAPAADAGTTLAIANVTVIDGTGAAPRPHQTVLVGGGRILQMGASRATRVPPGVQVIDGTGRYLVPGLWDMHVHAWNRQPFERIYLSSGIVGVREMGTGVDPQWGGEGVWRWREQVRTGQAPGPRVVAAGFILNGGAPEHQPVAFFKAAHTPQAARAWVDSLAGRGADFIKVYSALSPESYRAIASAAKEHGLPFAGHVPARVGVRAASLAGQRSIEHLYGFLVAASSAEDDIRRELGAELDVTTIPSAAAQLAEIGMTERLAATYHPARADSLFRLLAANGTWVTPTLVTSADPRCPGSPLPVPDSAVLAGVPAMLHGFVRLRADSADMVANTCRRLPLMLRLTRDMHRAGVRLLAGSDGPNPGIVPGVGLHQELELLVRAGLTPMEALQAATRNAAQYLGLERTHGTIEVGKAADLVLLSHDPLQDIRNTRRIHAVVVNGAVVVAPPDR